MIKKTLKSLLYGILISVLAIKAPDVHYNYIRNATLQTTVKVTNKKGNSGGSGFHVKAPSGKVYILTNAHVCKVKDEQGMVYITDDFERTIPRRVLEESDFTDLCLVESLPNYHDALKTGSKTKPGQIVAVVGHPRLMPTTMSRGEVIGEETVMVVSHVISDPTDKCDLPKNKIVEQDTFFGPLKLCTIEIKATLSNVIILPGNSGSPVVNFYGNLIGVAFAGNSANWGVFVTLDDVNKFLKAY